MKHSVFTFTLLVALSSLITPSKLYAQDAPTNTNAEKVEEPEEPSKPMNWQMGVYTGTFLPNRISYVRESLPFVGFKIGHDARFGRFEYDVLAAVAKGVSYYLGYISLRNEWNVKEAFGIHSLFGFDYSYYKPKPTEITQTQWPWRGQAGWHVGAGTEYDLSSTLMARADFRLGFGPGRTFNLNLGFMYQF